MPGVGYLPSKLHLLLVMRYRNLYRHQKKFLWASLFLIAFLVSLLFSAPNHQRANAQSSQVSSGFDRQSWSLVRRFPEALSRHHQDKAMQAIQLGNRALSLQQQGKISEAKQLIQDSLALMESSSARSDQPANHAALLDILGHILNSQGDHPAAIEAWQQAESIYQSLNLSEQTTNNQINQAVALQKLGLNKKACQTLLEALQSDDLRCPLTSIEQVPLSNAQTPMMIRGRHYLGAVLSSMGQLEQAQSVMATTAQHSTLSAQAQAGLYLSIGNNLRGQTLRLIDIPRQNWSSPAALSAKECAVTDLPTTPSTALQSAIACYQLAAAQGDATTRLQAQLNQSSLISEVPSQLLSAVNLGPEIELDALQTQLDQLPSSHNAVQARLKWVQTGLCYADSPNSSISPASQPCHNQSLTEQEPSPITPLALSDLDHQASRALQQAQAINDPRSIANAYGYLGAIALQQNDFQRGQAYTELALQQTTAYDSPETNYLWLWQLGRIYRQQGQTQSAIAAYQSTQQILQNLRADLVTATPDVQFAFRDSVEPVYRELVDLLLPDDTPSQDNLAQARDVIESLQLAELHNFYQQACLDAQPKAIETIDRKAAVIYAIALPKRLAVITSVPDQPLKYHNIFFGGDETIGGDVSPDSATSSVDQTVTRLISAISLPTRDRLAANRDIYDWLIRPSLPEFESREIKTLVFVLDGALREVPVAALHDGQHYLIEDYNVALTPGLQLLSPQALNRQRPRALAAGVSESVEGRPALPEVANELQSIGDILPTKILLNDDFTTDSLETSIQDVPYNVVHLATHAQFSSKADQTFLLAWDKRINVNDLDTVLRERQRSRINRPIELLTLSACQTAAGDKRAALGLAGVAMRSGARSTVASLWSIPDKSTAALMKDFYSALDQPNISKAEALRQAQLKMLRSPDFNEPRYWSAFVLVGNWL